jgi:hypothetical protein
MGGVLTLAEIQGELIPVIAMAIGGGIAVIAIIFGTVKQMVQTAEREKSRREIAAYIAEGSITPEDGERLMRAGRDLDRKC